MPWAIGHDFERTRTRVKIHRIAENPGDIDISRIAVLILGAYPSRAAEVGFSYVAPIGNGGATSLLVPTHRIAVDGDGNAYSTGSYSSLSSSDFDPGPDVVNLPTAGNADIYIQKLDSNGNFLWANSLGTPIYIDEGVDIVTDDSGNVYITGVFSDTMDFDPGPGTFEIVSNSPGHSDVFILKLDSSGNFVWAKSTTNSSIK